MFASFKKTIGLKYSPLPQDQVTLLEEGDSDRLNLQTKAKSYGIRANLSSNELRTAIALYESGKADLIPTDHIKKGKKVGQVNPDNTHKAKNFLVEHKKKAIGVSGGCCVILIIIVVLIILANAKN